MRTPLEEQTSHAARVWAMLPDALDLQAQLAGAQHPDPRDPEQVVEFGPSSPRTQAAISALRAGDALRAKALASEAVAQAMHDMDRASLVWALFIDLKALLLHGSFGAAQHAMTLLESTGGHESPHEQRLLLEARGWWLHGLASWGSGLYESSVEAFGGAVELHAQLGDWEGVVRCLDGRSQAEGGIGDYSRSLETVAEALATGKAHSCFESVHLLALQTATVGKDAGFEEFGLRSFPEVITRCRIAGDRAAEVRARFAYGSLLAHRAEVSPQRCLRAAQEYHQAIGIARPLALLAAEVEIRKLLVDLHRRVQAHESAQLEQANLDACLAQCLPNEASQQVRYWDQEQHALYEDRLQRLVRRLRSTLDSSDDAILLFGPAPDAPSDSAHNVCEACNAVARQLLGGDGSGPFSLSEVEDYPAMHGLRGIIEECCAHHGSFEDEFVLHQGGNQRHLARQVIPASPGAVVRLRDITEAKTRETMLREAAVRAEEGARAKSEFVAHMSHEVRTPIAGVLGLANILATTGLNERQRELVAGIITSGNVLHSIVGDILDLSRLEAGKLELNLEITDLRVLLGEVKEVFMLQCSQKNIVLSTRVGGSVPAYVEGDAGRIRQILINLVGNAVKFTDSGSVSVSIVSGPASTRFIVEDTGCGFRQEVADRLFEPYHQADGALGRGGTGLGLAISKRFAERMGGQIVAQGSVGKGSRFELSLPLRPVDPKVAQNKPSSRVRFDGARVLVAEDNPVNAMVIESNLRALGCVVEIVGNGASAVEKALSLQFDLVFMDVRMPVMDGLMATRLIREAEGRIGLRTPILALSAGAMIEERTESEVAGMDGYITKPFAPSVLVEALDKWVR